MRRREFGIQIQAFRARILIQNFLVFVWTWGTPPYPREQKTCGTKTRTKPAETKRDEQPRGKNPRKKDREQKKRENDFSRHETAHLLCWHESLCRFALAELNRCVDSRRPT